MDLITFFFFLVPPICRAAFSLQQRYCRRCGDVLHSFRWIGLHNFPHFTHKWCKNIQNMSTTIMLCHSQNHSKRRCNQVWCHFLSWAYLLIVIMCHLFYLSHKEPIERKQKWALGHLTVWKNNQNKTKPSFHVCHLYFELTLSFYFDHNVTSTAVTHQGTTLMM